MQLVIKLYIIKGNNTIAGIYFTNLIFLNNRFNMKVIIITAMDMFTQTKKIRKFQYRNLLSYYPLKFQSMAPLFQVFSDLSISPPLTSILLSLHAVNGQKRCCLNLVRYWCQGNFKNNCLTSLLSEILSSMYAFKYRRVFDRRIN